MRSSSELQGFELDLTLVQFWLNFCGYLERMFSMDSDNETTKGILLIQIFEFKKC